MRLNRGGIGSNAVVKIHYAPSSGAVPVGVPVASNVMAATFSSASFNFASQRFFSNAPRS